MNTRGQILIEHALVLLFLILPLMAGVIRWGTLEYHRTRCAYAGFLEARSRLIRENQAVTLNLNCGFGVSESITLVPLHEIESPDPLPSLSGWVSKASSLWEELSHFSSSSSEQDSG